MGIEPYLFEIDRVFVFLKNMRNSHLEKSKRNQRIRRLLAAGWTQTMVAEEYSISVQRVNDLVARFISRRLLKKTKNGFVIPKGRAKKLYTISPQNNTQKIHNHESRKI